MTNRLLPARGAGIKFLASGLILLSAAMGIVVAALAAPVIGSINEKWDRGMYGSPPPGR